MKPTILAIYVDFRLDYVFAQSGITQPRADRRLNGIENTLRALVRHWRFDSPITPERELRMSERSRSALLGWVEDRQRAKGSTHARMAIYQSSAVIEASVPDGWIRVLLSEHLPDV